MSDSKQNPKLKHGRQYLSLVLVSLTIAIIAFTLHYAKKPMTLPQDKTQGSSEGPTLAQRVRITATKDMQVREYAMACELMQTYITKFPDDVEVRPLLAKAQMAMGDNAAAERTLDEVIKRSPRQAAVLWDKGELVRRRGQENYMFFFRKAAEESVDVTPEIWTQFGRELLAQNQFEEARRWLGQAIDSGYSDKSALVAMAQVHIQSKQWPQAQELLDRAAEKAATDPQVMLLLARVCRQSGQLEKAGHIIDAALADHLSAELYMEQGEVRLAQNKPVEAAEAFVEAADFTKFRAQAAMRAATIYYEQRLLAQAAQQVGHVLELLPLDASAKELQAKIKKAAATTATSQHK